MRVGIYAVREASLHLVALETGVVALGGDVVWRNPNVYRRGEVDRSFDVVIVTGLRNRGQWIRDDYRAAGAVVMVIDYGYISRVNDPSEFHDGYWQLGLNDLGWLPPPGSCPADRLDQLGVEFHPGRAGRAVYVCAQMPRDAAHGMTDDEVIDWTRDTCKRVRELTDRPVVYRPHPRWDFNIGGPEKSEGQMNWNDCHAVVCYTSTIGIEALIQGVPVFCDTSAFYASLGNCSLEYIERPMLPPFRVLVDFMQRLAYAQYTLEEIGTGEPIRFVLNHATRESCRDIARKTGRSNGSEQVRKHFAASGLSQGAG